MTSQNIPWPILKKMPKMIQLAIEVNGDTLIESFDGTKGLIIAVDNGPTITLKAICPPKLRRQFAISLLKTLTKHDLKMVVSSILADTLEAEK
jgi:hypothetical protein